MRLPNADLAIVEREKITRYLLNPEHRYGASKARFFAAFGFEIGSWETLADALREHAQHHQVSKTVQTRWGPRFEIDGELNTPAGRQPRIRSVWQFDHGEIAPRLITAYPLEAEQ
jgi:filamentous hemagglutinin